MTPPQKPVINAKGRVFYLEKAYTLKNIINAKLIILAQQMMQNKNQLKINECGDQLKETPALKVSGLERKFCQNAIICSTPKVEVGRLFVEAPWKIICFACCSGVDHVGVYEH